MFERHQLFLDHSKKFTYASGAHETVVDHVVGMYPWCICVEEQQEEVRRAIDVIYQPGVTKHRKAMLWKSPVDGSEVYYISEYEWVGHADVAVVVTAYSFPKEFAKLSEQEERVLFELGNGVKPADIAAALDLSGNTVNTYARRIRQKLSIGPDELLYVAIKYAAALQ